MSPLIPWAPQRTVRSTGSDCPCSWTKPMSSRKKHSLFQDSPNDKTWQNIVTACLSLSIFFVKFRCQTSGGLLMPQRRLVCLTVGYGVPWSSWSSAATGKTKSHQQGGGTSQQKCQTRIYPTRHKPLTKSHAAPLKKKEPMGQICHHLNHLLWYTQKVTFFWINTHLSGLFWCYLHCWSPCCCIDHLGTQHVSICLVT